MTQRKLCPHSNLFYQDLAVADIFCAASAPFPAASPAADLRCFCGSARARRGKLTIARLGLQSRKTAEGGALADGWCGEGNHRGLHGHGSQTARHPAHHGA